MDQRQTFRDGDELFSFISEVFQQQQPAFLLIDRNGLKRVEGSITSITPHNQVDQTLIVLNDTIEVSIKEIMGINGIFRQEYSEC